MTKIKLYYFDGRGRAEISRLILAQAGVDYVDERIDREKWSEWKTTSPTGQVPALEYDGEFICQSNAIARFLAREFGLMGRSNLEIAKVDMIVDCATEVLEKIVACYFKEKDESRKQTLKENLNKDTFPTFLTLMETLLDQAGGTYFVGEALTLADIYVAMFLHDVLPAYSENRQIDTPKLDGLVKMVMNLPNIKAWIEKRPKTSF